MRQLADNIRILLADATGTDDKMRLFVWPQDFESDRVVEAYCIDVPFGLASTQAGTLSILTAHARLTGLNHSSAYAEPHCVCC